MYELLREYEINVPMLQSSEIGKTILQLYKHYDETPSNREYLRKLIDSWLKLIFNKNDNYKKMMELRESRGYNDIEKDTLNNNDDGNEFIGDKSSSRIKKLPVFTQNVPSGNSKENSTYKLYILVIQHQDFNLL